MLFESEKEVGLFLANLGVMDGEDSMGSAAGIVNMCSCCDSRKKNKPLNCAGLFSCIQGKQNNKYSKQMKMKKCETCRTQ